MPSKVVKGDDGKMYMEFPNGKRYELPSSTGSSGADPTGGRPLSEIPPEKVRSREFMTAMGDYERGTKTARNLNPEVMGGFAGLLAPETAGASLAIPAGAAGVTSLIQQFSRGERDPYTLLAKSGKHAALNAVPGLAGQMTRLVPGGLVKMVQEALTEGSHSHNFLGSLMGMGGKFTLPDVAAAGKTVIQKGPGTIALPKALERYDLTKPLTGRGVQAIKQRRLVDALRALLAGGSTAFDAKEPG